jgi:hypothetical protein
VLLLPDRGRLSQDQAGGLFRATIPQEIRHIREAPSASPPPPAPPRPGRRGGRARCGPRNGGHGNLLKRDGTGLKAVRPAGGRCHGTTTSRRSRSAHRGRYLTETLGGDHNRALRHLLVPVRSGQLNRDQARGLFRATILEESRTIREAPQAGGLPAPRRLARRGKERPPPPARPPPTPVGPGPGVARPRQPGGVRAASRSGRGAEPRLRAARPARATPRAAGQSLAIGRPTRRSANPVPVPG